MSFGAATSAATIAAALLESERRLGQLTETSLQAKLVHRYFRPLFANTAFVRLFGFLDVDQLLAEHTVVACFDAQTQADPLTAWQRATSGGATRTRMIMRRRDSAEFLADIYARPVLWDDEPAVALAILDVTGEDVARRNLAHAKAESEAASRAKRRFLSSASHGLRTPLHAAMGRLQLLQRADLAPPQAAMADEAMRACQRLLHHVDDVLDCSAAESGELACAKEPFQLHEALEAAVQIARDSTDATTIEARIGAGSAVALVGDERRTQRIVLALLEEAIARGPLGPIVIQADADSEGLTLQLNAPCAAQTGMEAAGAAGAIEGMAMARLLVSGLGGVLVHQGAAENAFNVTAFLPFPAAAKPAAATASAKGKRILVVEDNAGNRRLLHVILRSLGQQPTCAEGGAEGVVAAARQKFDLILMDLSMPGVDGFEAARRIRLLPQPHGATPIVALTASTGQDMRERAEEAGMDGFLQKPVEIHKLAAAIAMFAAADGSINPPEVQQIESEHNHDESDDSRKRGHGPTP
jgi:CheY-like chemotaxis protein/signal transduction histidine kinase